MFMTIYLNMKITKVYRYIVKTESNIKKLTENKVNDLISIFTLICIMLIYLNI